MKSTTFQIEGSILNSHDFYSHSRPIFSLKKLPFNINFSGNFICSRQQDNDDQFQSFRVNNEMKIWEVHHEPRRHTQCIEAIHSIKSFRALFNYLLKSGIITVESFVEKLENVNIGKVAMVAHAKIGIYVCISCRKSIQMLHSRWNQY